MPEQTKREQMVALKAAMDDEQKVAAQEACAFLGGSEMSSMIETLTDIQQRAIPGEYLDRSIANILTCIAAAQQIIPKQYPAPVEAPTPTA